jgi:hypothetical protein
LRSRIGAAAIRGLLAALLIVAGGDYGRASTFVPPPTNNPGGGNDRTGLYVVGGIVVGIIAAILLNRILAPPPPPPSSDQPPPPPPPPPGPTTQFTPRTFTTQAPGGGSGGSNVLTLRRGFDLPPLGVTAFVQDEVLTEGNIPDSVLQAIAAQFGLTPLETIRINLINRTLHRWKIGSGSVRDAIGQFARDTRFTGAQPIYLFKFAQGAAAPAANADQYAPAKLNIEGAHRLATGNGVRVALIDSAVDGGHPDLAGAIVETFNAVKDDAKPHPHGTGMAGAITARHTLLSVAPAVRLLTVEAFGSSDNSAEGTTLNILKGLDWAASQNARVVNMSFAGPADPRLRDALRAASNKGMVLIAASGNAGPNSPPLYPAADPNVIAVTATDAKNALFSQAVRGNHIAVSAPGVDVLVPAPGGAYQLSTGTSVAAAEVSGVAALMLERNPKLTGKEVRAILMRTALDLGPKGRDRLYGAGLVDALQAVTAASPPGH